MSIKCTVSILTNNNKQSLSKLLECLSDFDEVIICDGGSTDGTLVLASEFGCKIIQQNAHFLDDNNRIVDYSGVRNQCLNMATYQWFLYLDSDELIDENLKNEIKSVIINNNPSVYWIKRKYLYKNNIIDCATTYPNKQLRFFHRSVVNKFIKKVHERIDVNDKTNILTLDNYMYVPLLEDCKSLLKKWNKYVDIELSSNSKVSNRKLIRIIWDSFKISILYLLRTFKVYFFCKGNKLPLRFELIRHIYHFRLIKSFIIKKYGR